MENKLKGTLQIGQIIFFTGLFFLPSALSLGVFLLLISICISFSKNSDHNEDNINLILYLACIFLFLSSTVNFFNNTEIYGSSNNSFITFIGLLNWIPQILLYKGCQKYLTSIFDRKKCIIAIIFGSIPVIFSCISQALLNWHGPFETFFGLIVWYQRPLDGITGMTGLFSNPNYLGAWLNIIWPFCLSFLYFDNKNTFKVISKIFLSVSVSTLIILTASRGAWVCLLITLPLIFGTKIKKWSLIFVGFFSIIIINLSFPLFGSGFQDFLRLIIPKGLWINFTSAEFESLDISRMGIWENTINFVIEKPIFGHGSNSFPRLFFDETGFWKGHAHNLPLELFVNYGIPATLLILIPITYLIFKSFFILVKSIKTINKETIIDRAWLTSFSILFLTHLIDIPYFDGRISLTGWILLAGTRNIIINNKNKLSKKETIN